MIIAAPCAARSSARQSRRGVPSTVAALPEKSAMNCGVWSTLSRLNLGLMISMLGMTASIASSTSSRA